MHPTRSIRPLAPLLLTVGLLVAGGLAGCASDHDLIKGTGYTGGPLPIVAVEPTVLDFGTLGAGELATQIFTVANVGETGSVLEVSGIRIEGPDAGFTITSGNTTLSLAPEDPPESIIVAFTPMGAYEQASAAIVDSNDVDNPQVPVALRGEGLVPELQITPDPLDLGRTYVGCERDNVLTLTNVGTDLLTVTDLAEADGVFALVNTHGLPIDLEPGDSADVHVTFAPVAEGDASGTLTATSNEPMGTRTASQIGSGVFSAAFEDAWVVPAEPEVDLVFFVDQSGSMDDDQSALADNFEAFITQLSTYTSAWQIIVANDDDGCNYGGILTQDAPNYASQFSYAVKQGGGVWTEAGLTVASRAVEETDSGDCNAGFLRPDALLHVVFVSDEPEQSSNPWATYLSDIQDKKGDASLVKLSAVAGDYPAGCKSRTNSAEYGEGYYQAVNATGGEFLSLCSDWGANVEALADASVSRTSFTLTHTPVPDSIVVTVNEVTVGGWHYEATSNSILFDTNAPVEGDEVVATYAGEPTCD